MMDEEEFALAVWQNGSNDDVWTALFDPPKSRFYGRDIGDLDFTEVAGELLEKIERDPDFTVGDLTHDECIAAILRRYPILGPNPHFGR